MSKDTDSEIISKLYSGVHKVMFPNGNTDINNHIQNLKSIFSERVISAEQLKKLFLRSIIKYIISEPELRKDEVWQMQVFNNARIPNYTERELLDYFEYLESVIPKNILLEAHTQSKSKNVSNNKKWINIIFIILYIMFFFSVYAPVSDYYGYSWLALFVLPALVFGLIQFGIYIWNEMLGNRKPLSDKILGEEYEKARKTFIYFNQGRSLGRDEVEALDTIVREVFILSDKDKR